MLCHALCVGDVIRSFKSFLVMSCYVLPWFCVVCHSVSCLRVKVSSLLHSFVLYFVLCVVSCLVAFFLYVEIYVLCLVVLYNVVFSCV